MAFSRMPKEILSKDDLQAMGKFNQNGVETQDALPPRIIEVYI